ncbi:MAG: hypothetical protein COB41_07040 [Proteobacteria bacterium]|nr:MAG: hypothetical protein COB41_07040 [Pseudomonadota bacterium]
MAHGMGEIKEKDFEEQVEAFRQQVGKLIGSRLNAQVLYCPVFFQDIFQKQQSAVFEKMDQVGRFDWKWTFLRKFLLFGFSDAAGYESHASVGASEYERVQERIRDAIDKACGLVGNDSTEVLVIAQSLGTQVLSNYIWDAQQDSARVHSGIWRSGYAGNGSVSTEREAARRLKTMRYFLTTGCNIPIFIAGKKRIQAIKPDAEGYHFEWHNYYDKDDVLGWPLQPLGYFYDVHSNDVDASYRKAVADHRINVGNIFTSWNPFCHTYYWSDKDFIKPTAAMIENLLK